MTHITVVKLALKQIHEEYAKDEEYQEHQKTYVGKASNRFTKRLDDNL